MLRAMFNKPRLARRMTVLMITVVVMGFCVSVFQQIGFGTDPCATMTKGVSLCTGLNYGISMFLVSFAMFAVILLLRHYTTIGPGTIIVMFLLGYVVDFFNWIFNSFCPLGGYGLLVKSCIFVATMLLFLITVAFYTVVDMGTAPYDALPIVLADKQKKIPYAFIRMAQDIFCTVVGFLMGGPVGIVTIIVCFFMGPVVALIVAKCKYLFE